MKTIEDWRKFAEFYLCENCIQKYKVYFEPNISHLLLNPIDDWREVESDITLMVMVTKGVLKRENIYLSLGEGSYLFSWNKIPRDNGRLIKFLKQNYSIDWVKTAKIERVKGVKTIKLSTEKNSLSLRLNDENTKVSLKINDGRTDEFIVKTGSKNIEIYKKDKEGSNEVLGEEIDREAFLDIKLESFTKKIDYLYTEGILEDFSHRVLDEANEVRNKIHEPSIVARFSEQDLILFHDARVVTDDVYRATMDDCGKEISTNLKNRAEEYAKQCLLKLNYQW